ENIGSEVARLEKIAASSFAKHSSNDIPEISIAPMGNMPVIKDLVVDMKGFWGNLQKVEPYVSTQSRAIPEREFLQSPEDRAKLNQMGNCILCGACYSDCNALEVNPEFAGPHALAKAYRMVADNRDDRTENRLEEYNQGTAGVWGCTRCYNCNSVCPMEVAPMDQISKIKHEILERKDASDSTPVRHRKVMVDLVKQGGWVDERKFGIFVVGNYFRDLKGLLGLGPLGLRMLSRGKFPLSFEPSEGTKTVRSLIESVQRLEQQP
ncbi:MAG: succinate dehydrogenase/fumarate reductase iron-sulfur subunit, partial [Cyanobacteriota bacterium]|nr:succinate dehydrogenase/fumarate reductase iron-sulfur subunit [Cyanobacteriota bacterium]